MGAETLDSQLVTLRLYNLEPIHANPFGSLHIQSPSLNLFTYGPDLLSISFCYLTSLQVCFHSMHQSLFQFPLCSALDFIYPNSCQSEGEVCSPLPCTSAFSDKQMDLSVSLYANRHGLRPENRQQADTWGASQAVFLTK